MTQTLHGLTIKASTVIPDTFRIRTPRKEGSHSSKSRSRLASCTLFTARIASLELWFELDARLILITQSPLSASHLGIFKSHFDGTGFPDSVLAFLLSSAECKLPLYFGTVSTFTLRIQQQPRPKITTVLPAGGHCTAGSETC